MARRDPVRLLLDSFLRRRRRGRVWLTILAVIALLVLAWVDRQGWLLHQGDDIVRFDGQTFVVERVIDGDTLVLADPDATRVRLWGIDTPELRPRSSAGSGGSAADDAAEPWAREARDRARDLVEGRRVRLTVETHRVRDTYDRLLAFVIMPDGVSLNEQLLVEGLAEADDRWPHRDIERYELLETQARKRGLGLWSD